MQHVQLKATTTATDQDLGTFEAIVSAWDADREGDVIDRRAFDKTIAAWRASGKSLPLLFEHSAIVVGAVDPDSIHPTDAGLVVAGEVDRDTDEGRQVWRTIKSGTAGFSIGFMSESRPREGGRELVEIDLLEVSVTSTPMHPSTRALSWKSAGGAGLTPEHQAELDRYLVSLNKTLTGTNESTSTTKSAAPIQIASFEC